MLLNKLKEKGFSENYIGELVSSKNTEKSEILLEYYNDIIEEMQNEIKKESEDSNLYNILTKEKNTKANERKFIFKIRFL